MFRRCRLIKKDSYAHASIHADHHVKSAQAHVLYYFSLSWTRESEPTGRGVAVRATGICAARTRPGVVGTHVAVAPTAGNGKPWRSMSSSPSQGACCSLASAVAASSSVGSANSIRPVVAVGRLENLRQISHKDICLRVTNSVVTYVRCCSRCRSGN